MMLAFLRLFPVDVLRPRRACSRPPTLLSMFDFRLRPFAIDNVFAESGVVESSGENCPVSMP
jgi:hypothetical protein